MSKRNPRLLIEDILESMEKIDLYVETQDFAKFKENQKTIDAVIRNLKIIGEAANQIPEEIKKEYSSINWRQIVGLRNRVIHEYFGVDLTIIWEIIQKDLDKFEDELRKLKSSL